MISRVKDWIDRGRWRLSEWPERLSTWVHPGYRIAPLTTERVERFHAFWQDLGMAEAYESTGENEDDIGPQSLAAAAGVEDAGDPTISDEAAKRIRTRFVEAGRLTELNQILFDVPEGRAGQIPTDVVEVVLGNFIAAYVTHRARLLGMQSATESSSAT